MGTPDPRKILRVPGTLIKDPTSVGASDVEPYGGTFLGIARTIVHRFNVRYAAIGAEEYGNMNVEHYYAGESGVLSAILRDVNPDAMNLLFPSSSTGSGSGNPVVAPVLTGANAPGRLKMASRGFKLLFAPKARDDHPFILLYNAIPLIDQQASLEMAVNEEIGVPVIFEAAPDSSLRTTQIAWKEELAL